MTGAITKMAAGGSPLSGMASQAMSSSPIMSMLSSVGSGATGNPFEAAMGQNAAGAVEPPNSLPQLDALPQLDLTAPQGGTPQVANVTSPEAYRNAIASIESKGSGDYGAVGPRHPSMGRALGRYQVMEENIPSWSREALGRVVSTEEFMRDPKIQDAIFDKKFGSYVEKYGEPGAAQAWFAGEGGVGKTNRKDSLGTSVGVYGDKFMNALGQPLQTPKMAGHPAGGSAFADSPKVGAGSDDPYATIFANMFQSPDKPGQGEMVQKSAMERMTDALQGGGGGGMQVASGASEAPQVQPAYDDSPEYLAQANQRINTSRGANTRAQERKAAIRDRMKGTRI